MTSSDKRGRPGSLDGKGLRVAIVCGRFNDFITDRLLRGARLALVLHGVDEASIAESWVPGAFEIPLAVQRYAASGEVDAVIALGAVIRGDTPHFDFVAGECAAGLQRVQLDTGIPVAFGVLTTDTEEQADVRAADDETNKGYEAAETALEMALLLRQLTKDQS
jgi:6,7-dimethyl-8-ribityllumazine synthase